MSLSSIAQTQALNAIKAYGAPATLGVTTLGAYDPVEGTTGSTTTQTAVHALLDASSLQGLGATFGVDMVRSNDLKATIPAKGLTADPKPGDTLTVRGSVYSVVSVRSLFVGADAVTFEMLVRR